MDVIHIPCGQDCWGEVTGTEDLEATDEVADIVREFVDGLPGSDKSMRAFFVKAVHPVGDRNLRDREPSGRFGGGPASSSPELKDGHSLDRSVVGPSVGRQAEHACIFDPQLFLQKTIVVLELIDATLVANPGAAVGRSLSLYGSHAVPGEGDCVEHGRLHTSFPGPRDADLDCHGPSCGGSLTVPITEADRAEKVAGLGHRTRS